MPGIPSQHQPRGSGTAGIHVSTYSSIDALPTHVWKTLEKYERPSNVILPLAQTLSSCRHQDVLPGQFWMTCETTRSPASSASERQPELDFILSCTEWHMGTYPIFMVSTHPTHALTAGFLAPRVALLAAELHVRVPIDRVYSIFAPAPLSKAFAQAWSTVSGVELEERAYYAARFSHCSRRTFVNRASITPNDHDDSTYNLRLAREDDISQVAALCKGFASKSEPFFLDDTGALKEAKYLIENRIGWVHEVVKNGISEIACLVATTRNSGKVATITKVYTSPAWRKRGCAERLVRAVCHYYLISQRKEWIVLYVGHDNPAAKVYDKVGFVGLCGKPRVEGIDDWIEIGCRGARLGHW